MKRLRHIAFSWLAAISFLLFLFCCAMWPISYWHSLSVDVNLNGADLRHDSKNGVSIAATEGLTIISFSRSILPATVQAARRREQFGIEPHPISFDVEWEATDPLFGNNPVNNSVFGFGYQVDRGGVGTDELYDQDTAEGPATVSELLLALQLPLWFWILVLGVLPCLWARGRLRTYRRRKYGLCRRCGYDVRATTQLCPECGTQRPLDSPQTEPTFLLAMAILSALISFVTCAFCIESCWRIASFNLDASGDEVRYELQRNLSFYLRDGVAHMNLRIIRTTLTDALATRREAAGVPNRGVRLSGSWEPQGADLPAALDDFPQITRRFGDFGYGYSRSDSKSVPGDLAFPGRTMNLAWQWPCWFVAIVFTLPLTLIKIARLGRATKAS